MKKRNRIGLIATTLAAVLAGSIGVGQSVANANPNTTRGIEQNVKSTPAAPEKKRGFHKEFMRSAGGLSMMNHFTDYGMSPMEYGMRFGHGNSRKHTNLLRCSHNSKIKRRSK